MNEDRANDKRLGLLIIGVFFAFNVLVSLYLIALQTGAIQARQEAAAQRSELKKQNDSIFCVLFVHPEARNDAVYNKCRENP